MSIRRIGKSFRQGLRAFAMLFCGALAEVTFGEKIKANVTANAIGSCDDMEETF
jgi:hypothetical protein